MIKKRRLLCLLLESCDRIAGGRVVFGAILEKRQGVHVAIERTEIHQPFTLLHFLLLIGNEHRLGQFLIGLLPFLRQDHILVVTVIAFLTLNVSLMQIRGDFVPKLHPFQIVRVLGLVHRWSLRGKAQKILLLRHLCRTSISKPVLVLVLQLLLK